MYNKKVFYLGVGMKKIFLSIMSLMMLSLCALADDKADVLAAFNQYVNAANSYSKDLPSYYIQDAKIVRVVNKKQGGQKAVIIPFDRYLKELGGHSTLAKTVGYKNNYVNRRVEKTGNDYKILATRIPRNDKTGLPCYFVYTKQNGAWKIKEESMTTNVQTFLNAK